MVKAKATIAKKTVTTHDVFMQSMTPTQKKVYKKEYRDLLLSELILAIMKNDEISIRELAKGAGVSPTIIQGIRTGTRKNLTLQSFLKIAKALGCSVFLKKGSEQITLNPQPESLVKPKKTTSKVLPITRERSMNMPIHAKKR